MVLHGPVAYGVHPKGLIVLHCAMTGGWLEIPNVHVSLADDVIGPEHFQEIIEDFAI